MTLRRPAAILLAVALDLALGEPPGRWHPVAWLGRALGWAERRAPGRSVADGAAAVTLVTAGAWGAARLLAAAARALGGAGVVLEALALKPAFALRRLGEAAEGVETALRAGDIETARTLRRTGSGEPADRRPRGGRGGVGGDRVRGGEPGGQHRGADPRLRGGWAAGRVDVPRRQHGRRDVGISGRALRAVRQGRRAPRRSGEPRARSSRRRRPRGGLRPSSARTAPAPPGSRGRSIAARRARTPAGRWRRWPVPSTSGSRSAGRTGSGRARCPASPDAIRRARRVLGAAAGITVVLAGGGRAPRKDAAGEPGRARVSRGLGGPLTLSVLAHSVRRRHDRRRRRCVARPARPRSRRRLRSTWIWSTPSWRPASDPRARTLPRRALEWDSRGPAPGGWPARRPATSPLVIRRSPRRGSRRPRRRPRRLRGRSRHPLWLACRPLRRSRRPLRRRVRHPRCRGRRVRRPRPR